MTPQEPNATTLPTESDVIAELEEYLIKMCRPVTPSEAYRSLADRFSLTPEARTRLMPNGKEVHWENRVRFAMRKLRDAGKIDTTQPRGRWAVRNTNRA
jgi:restriction endonuclease Mrr